MLLIEMISLTMSRISSRARFGVELRELRQVDRLDQRGEDRALDLVVGFRAARVARGRDERLRAASGRERRRGDRRAEPVGRQRREADIAAAAPRRGARAGSGGGATGAAAAPGCAGRGPMWNAFRTRCISAPYACLRLSFSMSGVNRSVRDRFISVRPVSVCASERKVSRRDARPRLRRSSGRCWRPCRTVADRTGSRRSARIRAPWRSPPA